MISGLSINIYMHRKKDYKEIYENVNDGHC